ncbi:MAG: MFS transporter, partial [Actinobacteria bacterium]|nr:MFS transporter [Actinomycetota bacterium]
MGLEAYRGVLARRDVRRLLALSFALRVPLWAGNVVLTLHVVTHLHRSYGMAGLLTGVATVALTISGPWRGRLLDRRGLRATVVPSLVVLTLCWSVAPFVGYWPLLVLVWVAGLFVVPSFSVVRQGLIHAVDDSQRKSALAIDAVTVEVSFMVGPVLGVLLATYVPTSWALFGCEFCTIAGGVLLWLVNPSLRAPGDAAGAGPRPRVRSWLTAPVVAVLVTSMAATIVLTGTDVGVVAALRHMGHQSWIGWELAVWGFGSAVGALAYGALHRPVPVVVLLALLAAATLPIAAARNPLTFAALVAVAGVFCAPTVTATVDALSRVVPEAVRGEALGWHGSAMTAGSAVGAPVA